MWQQHCTVFPFHRFIIFYLYRTGTELYVICMNDHGMLPAAAAPNNYWHSGAPRFGPTKHMRMT